MSAPILKDYDPPNVPLDILYVDDDILVLNKPNGLLSVPGRTPEKQDCLATRAEKQFTGVRIVHRLDMETSGVIIMARHMDALRHLGRQFEERKTDKIYEARVYGHLSRDEGEIDLPVLIDWPNRPKHRVDFENGRAAFTRYKVLAREEKSTRVALYPVTGRSHQLRVHMLSLGHAILGDNLYAQGEAFTMADRLCLHARQLTLAHPESGESLTFDAPVPF
ncbi:RluA family pseudouridine synthase [Kordiimonas sp.]|uniref:RluA family pseudouridine synthase n=1 Tax=Kordiimonas sp. TaxID=1970157 RepID=UPI003A94E70A